MFRILVVDDDRASAQLLQEVMKNLQRPHELYFVSDGVEALDFLHCRGAWVGASHPNLILLDMTMPRLSGLETLSAIKNDSELGVIPVIMHSSVSSPTEVRKCYAAHANCYVLKPTSLERSVKFVQAVEAFWMDFALLPSYDGPSPESIQTADSKRKDSVMDALHPGEIRPGPEIAIKPREAMSRAIHLDGSPVKETAAPARVQGCDEHNRLLDGFGEAVQELLKLHEQQFLAIVGGDAEGHRFDLLIHMANEKKQSAKYAYLLHVESHGCSNTDAIDET